MIGNILIFFKYLNFNKIHFKYNQKSKNIVLVEFPNLKSFAISSSYFSHVLCKINDAKPILYFPNFLNYKKKLILFLQSFNPFSCLKIFKSFTVGTVIPYKHKKILQKEKKIKFIFNKIKSKKTFLKIKYNNILIGDLLYDEYLAKYKVPTINLKSKQFEKFFFETFNLIFFWEDFLKNSNVKSIVLSHSVYIMGLIGRIGISKKIDVYVVSPQSHYKLTKKKYIKWNDHYDYPSQFKKIKKISKLKLLKDAKKNLDLRLSGKKDFRYKIARPINSVFSKNQITSHRPKNKITNILIASHCFMDAPHVYGEMIFNDFYDWLKFLGKISNKKSLSEKVNWYIKVHPSLYDENIKVFKGLLEEFPKFKLIDRNETHNNLINKIGIDFVLTVYGSIAHEYPLFGIPVLNAGTNPHMGYKFSVSPKTKKDYNISLKNLIDKKNKIKPHKKQIYEFYAMHHLVDYDFFEDMNIDYDLGKADSIYTLAKYIEKTDITTHKKKIEVYKNFINSKSRRLCKKL